MDDLQHQDVCHYKCHEIGHHQYQYPLNEQQPTSQEVAGPSVDGPLNSQKGGACVSPTSFVLLLISEPQFQLSI